MKGPSRKLKIALATAAAAAMGVLVLLQALDLRRQREQMLRDGDARAANVARVLSAFVAQTFGSVDAALRQLVLHSERIGGASAPASGWMPALTTARAAATGLGSISVVDRSGVIRFSTQALIMGQSRREGFLFRQLQSDTAGDVVADPPMRVISGARPYVIPLGRRLITPTGEFDGAVVATFVPDALREVFRTADVGQDGMVAVFHRSGHVVFREPSTHSAIGDAVAGDSLFTAATRPGAHFHRGRATPDGPILRTAIRGLPEQGLILAVSLGEHELLAPWRGAVTRAIAIAVVLAIALSTMLWRGFREMDTRYAAEEALNRSQRLESIGRLTGGIAHDFNNLLTVILGNAKLIARERQSDSTAESASQIERAARRGSALIQQLLAFARRQPLRPRVIDLAALARDTVPMVERVIGEDIALQLRIGSGETFASIDPVRAESALLNLCINARDAMSDGGTITIEVEESADAVAPLREVVLAVTDTGSGIAPEHLTHLFEPFFTTKEVGRGTGLGLSTVYGFVTQSGGRVKVDSEVGRGTSVRMFFPHAPLGVEATAAVPGRSEIARGNGEVLLVIEDQPEVARLARRFLEDAGYRVVTAADAASARDAARAEDHIDLLVSDIVLPGGLRGPQIATELRASRPGLRTLFVSGYAEEALEGLSAGKVDSANVLSKPYDREQLVEAVGRALRGA